MELEELKEKRNAVILAHLYQDGEVQDVADFLGDSFGLSKKAVETDADTIVFCGVKFMAETASILNPKKTVLLPDKYSGCGLADMATVKDLKKRKSKYPKAAVVSYVNSSAEIKAESDVCCTSANALKVVESLSQEQVLFLPDRNLASYVSERTDKDIIPWDGYCYVHENITVERIDHLKNEYPNAAVMVHPECVTPVRHFADFIGSTSQMLRYAKDSERKEFIVGTEDGLVYALEKENPDKRFYPVESLCDGMKMIDLEKVRYSLKRMKYRVLVPEGIRVRAKKALDRMLEVT